MNEENKKKHYLIYQTTNLVNNKIYIGKHITEDIEDQYFGSGKNLKWAIEKYGLENFEFKILFELQNEEEMNLLEKLIVTQEFCDREDTYNINVGGDGGWNYVNSTGKSIQLKQQYLNLSPEEKYNMHKKAILTRQNWSNDKKLLYSEHISNSLKLWNSDHPDFWAGKNNPMYGHIYTKDTLQKMSDSHKGSKNSQYGTMWICNNLTKENRKIKKSDLIPEGWRKGRIC